jgi:hypothetical protein
MMPIAMAENFIADSWMEFRKKGKAIMKYKLHAFIIRATICTALLPIGIYAEEASIFPLAADIAGDNLVERRDAYLAERGWEMGWSEKNPNGAYIGWATAAMNIPASDPRFGQDRIATFERAFTDAKGSFVRSRERRQTVSTMRAVFNDDREIDDSAFATQRSRQQAIEEKLRLLEEAELDQKLRALGVSPGDIQQRSTRQKRTLARDEFSRSITTEAMQAIGGLRVLQTFEDERAIGVLVVYSERLREISAQIARGNAVPAPSGSDKRTIQTQLRELVQDWPADLAFQHGVRHMTDEKGHVALVAFGQWSAAVTRSDTPMRQRMALDAAKRQARELADAQLTLFVNNTLVWGSETTIEATAKIQRVLTDVSTQEIETARIGSMLEEMAKEYGQSRLPGITIVEEWTGNHPSTGHLLAGVIVMWSPSTGDAARTGSRRSADQIEGRAAPRGQGGIRESADFDRTPDF